MTDDLVSRAIEALEAATPGSWGVSETGLTNDGGRPVINADRRVAVADAAVDLPKKQMWQSECAEREANARLIAMAPDLARALIAAHEQMAGLVDAAEALGALPNGYCFCSSHRDGGSEIHEPECRDLRAALAQHRQARGV